MMDLNIILINYNTANFTLQCVDSIIKHTNKSLNFEIIIVDNASAEEDFEHLKKGVSQINSSKVKLVKSKINTGFGGGNMFGYQFTKPAKYVLFINNDVELFNDDSLMVLKNFMDENPTVGIASPQSYNENMEFVPTIDHFASIQREIFKRKTLEFLLPSVYLKRLKKYKEPIKVQFITGSFMFVRRASFNAVGGFDTNLFLYYEETDLSRRMLTINQSTYLHPQIGYKHYHGASTKKSLAIKIEQKLSLLYVIKKHQGWFAHKLLLLFFIIRYFFTLLIKPNYFKLWLTFLQGAPLSKSLKQQQKITT